MEIGVAKIAEDSDFFHVRELIDDDTHWKLDYRKADTQVWIKNSTDCDLNFVKMKSIFRQVNPNVVYDVLHDNDYRKFWDSNMLISKEIGHFNPNNDAGYYAISCPKPLKDRDFVLQRSWLDIDTEKIIINHSIFHKDYPPCSEFIRAYTYITGYVIRSTDNENCFFGYISQCDPQGKLPSWFINKLTQVFAPKFFKRLQNAVRNYDTWKKNQANPSFKPWINPEQIRSPKINISEVFRNIEFEMKFISNLNYKKKHHSKNLLFFKKKKCQPHSQEILIKEQKRIRRRSPSINET